MSSRTFIVLKPDALARGLVDQVMARFINEGYRIDRIHYRVIDPTLIRLHYKEVIEREGPAFVDWLDQAFVGHPAIAMVLSYDGDDAIGHGREMLGNRRPSVAEKGTIRGDFGIPQEDPDTPAMNLIHASDSQESFEKEMALWFES